MIEDISEFDALVNLHTEIRSFKINKSVEILENFRDKDEAKFKLNIETEGRINLSSTTVCTHTLAQYLELWDENKKPEYRDKFKGLNEYYEFIVNGLKANNIPEKEFPDEFTLVNVLSLLKKIKEKIKNQNHKKPDEGVMRIIKALCKQFIENEFVFVEKTHPFIYYKFLLILEDYAQEIFEDIKENKSWWKVGKDEGKLNSFVDEVKDKDGKAILNYFFKRIYGYANYEMYRQIALCYANDETRFDVKRLIYSLLIAKKNDRYSNNLIIAKALELIFEKQLNTGLLPLGQVINQEFVLEKGEISSKPIIASPILSSVECFNDMLMHESLKTDLERYQENFKLVYEWIMKTLIKNSDCKLLGWYPEYKTTIIPESWVAGCTLLFLKKYCEMLSDLIKKSAAKYLHAKESKELDITWDELYDSYKIKEYIKYMTSNPKYRSALIFGPPGSGKSMTAKVLAKKMGMEWHYVELTPGLFLAKSHPNIISEANYIFKRLIHMKNTVILFDEVDLLVKSREKDGSEWIVTALLPKFTELWSQKEIKFILVTNDITKVDPAVMRSGRIDLILPMGGICWRDRLKIVCDAIDKSSDQIKKNLKDEKLFKAIGREQIDKAQIENEKLRTFLMQTNYVPALEIKRMVEILFNKDSWEEVKKSDLYNIFFEGRGEIGSFEKPEFKTFHEDLRNTLCSIIKLPDEMIKEKYKRYITSVIEDNIF